MTFCYSLFRTDLFIRYLCTSRHSAVDSGQLPSCHECSVVNVCVGRLVTAHWHKHLLHCQRADYHYMCSTLFFLQVGSSLLLRVVVFFFWACFLCFDKRTFRSKIPLNLADETIFLQTVLHLAMQRAAFPKFLVFFLSYSLIEECIKTPELRMLRQKTWKEVHNHVIF